MVRAGESEVDSRSIWRQTKGLLMGWLRGVREKERDQGWPLGFCLEATGWIKCELLQWRRWGKKQEVGTEIKSCVLKILSLKCLSDSKWRC